MTYLTVCLMHVVSLETKLLIGRNNTITDKSSAINKCRVYQTSLVFEKDNVRVQCTYCINNSTI